MNCSLIIMIFTFYSGPEYIFFWYEYSVITFLCFLKNSTHLSFISPTYLCLYIYAHFLRLNNVGFFFLSNWTKWTSTGFFFSSLTFSVIMLWLDLWLPFGFCFQFVILFFVCFPLCFLNFSAFFGLVKYFYYYIGFNHSHSFLY